MNNVSLLVEKRLPWVVIMLPGGGFALGLKISIKHLEYPYDKAALFEFVIILLQDPATNVDKLYHCFGNYNGNRSSLKC